MAQSPEEMAAAMINNMQANTGKTLPEWIAIVERSGLAKHGEIVKYLKSEHDMTHGYANMVSHEARAKAAGGTPTRDDLVTAQYAGPKAALRQIYDALVAQVTEFGADVELSPKKTYVSLRRNKQFGLIKPATKTRVDVGINLNGFPPTERLLDAGKNSMVSHNVRVTAPEQVDDELIGWLNQAYEES